MTTTTRANSRAETRTSRPLLSLLSGVSFVCASFSGPSRADAQSTSTTPPLELAQAMALARAHAPALRLVGARQDMAIGHVRETVQYPNPTIEHRQENLGSALLPDIFTTLYLPVDISGRRWNLRSAGRAGTERATADGQAKRREAEIHIASEWVRAAAVRAEAHVVNDFTIAVTEMARVDSIRFAEGFVSEAIALRTRLESDRARVALATATTRVAQEQALLARTLGVNDDVVATVAELMAPTLPAGPDSEVALLSAMQSRPDIVAREAGVREAEYRARAESRGMLGDWQLQGGSKKTSGIMTSQFGLAIPLPLFNRNEGARQRTRGELAEATALRDDVLNSVRAETRAALLAYIAIQQNAGRVNTFAARGRELAAIARTSYAEGNSTLIELLDAERAGVDAQTARIAWMVEAWMARLELERVIGARLDGESPLDLPLVNAALNTSSIPR